jgi:sugar lactone lactonase YvrE
MHRSLIHCPFAEVSSFGERFSRKLILVIASVVAVAVVFAVLPAAAQTPAVTLASGATSPVSFPATAVNSAAAAQNVLLSINANLTISGITVAASQGGVQEFVVGAVPDCAVDGVTVISAGATCTVPVTFQPGYPGVRQQPLVVQTSLSNFQFGLEGIGQGAQVAFVPGLISTVAGVPLSQGWSYLGDGVPATTAYLSSPSNVALDATGDLYFADTGNNAIREVAAGTGIITTMAGNGACDYTGDGGPATAAAMCYPMGLALDAAGNLYIADSSNNAIREVTATTGVISTVAGAGPDACAYVGDGGPATIALLCGPAGVALDAAGNLYIADSLNNAIREVSAGVITTVVGDGTGNCAYLGDSGPATGGELCNPEGLALDTAGNLYIADNINRLVREVDAQSGNIFTVAGTVTAGPSGVAGPATSVWLPDPTGVAVDAAANLYIADFMSNVVSKVDAATNWLAPVAGTGAAGYLGDGLPATGTWLNNPAGVAVDAAGNLYIADQSNDLIREVSAGGIALFSLPSPDPQTLALSNTGNLPLDISALTASSNFLVDNTTCSLSAPLAAGDSCAASVDYTPGGATGTLTVTDDALNVSGATQQAQLAVQAAMPSFSPSPGAYGSAKPVVTMSDATPGAVIYYTTDGSTPTAASTPYTAPLTLSRSTLLTAIAVAPGYMQSTPLAGWYFVEVVQPPTFVPPPGSYNSIEIVAIRGAGIIYYTTDGSTPTTASTRYTGPITLTSTTTLQAIVVKSPTLQSYVAGGTYTLTNNGPISCIATDSSGNDVTLSTSSSSPTPVIYGQTVNLVCLPTGLLYVPYGGFWVPANTPDNSAGSLTITKGTGTDRIKLEQEDYRHRVVQSAIYYFQNEPYPVTYTAQSYTYYYGVPGQAAPTFTRSVPLVGNDVILVSAEMWNPNTNRLLNVGSDPLTEALTGTQSGYLVKLKALTNRNYAITLNSAPLTFAANNAGGVYTVTPPTTTVFGPYLLGTRSRSLKAPVFTFTSLSGAEVTWSLSGTDTSNNFTLGPNCTTYRGTKDRCTISVAFNPQSVGAFTDTITVTAKDASTGAAINTGAGSTTLTGYTYGSFTTDAATYSVARGGSTNITITNNSGFALTASGMLAGTGLSLTSTSCTAGTASPGNTCQLTVQYTGYLRPGSKIGMVDIYGGINPTGGGAISLGSKVVTIFVQYPPD